MFLRRGVRVQARQQLIHKKPLPAEEGRHFFVQEPVANTSCSLYTLFLRVRVDLIYQQVQERG